MSLGIDMGHPEGINIIRKLVEWADIIVESFAPGVMETLGLGYEDIQKINPVIIFLRTNMLGTTGPRSQIRGYGFQLVGYTGFTYITGWPDRIPVQPFGPYTDTIAPRFATSALIMALIHKRRTGKGTYIDLSQHEAGIQFLTPILLDRQINNRIKEREGNSHPLYCPNGVYPCKGKQRWVAITITSNKDWKAFSGIINKQWLNKKEFSTFKGRKHNEEKIDSLIAQWTIEHTAEEITRLLQEKGIPAGIVKDSQDIVNDPQLAHRRAIWYLEHEYAGRHAVLGQGSILSRNPPPPPRAAPSIGEHTYYICQEILNIPDEEIARLLGDGILQIMV